MSALATSPGLPVAPGAARERIALPRREAKRLFEPSKATLDERIAGIWERLIADGAAECPVCRAELATGRPCSSCGSELG